VADAIVADRSATEAIGAAHGRVLHERKEAPFDRPPEPWPNANRSMLRGDMSREVDHLHEAVRRVLSAIAQHPEAFDTELLERVRSEADTLIVAIIEHEEVRA
jgi:hypothetical protein